VTRVVVEESTVRYGSARYSVPHRLVGERVWVRVVAHVGPAGASEAGRHPLTTPGNPRIDPAHYPEPTSDPLHPRPEPASPDEGPSSNSDPERSAGSSSPRRRSPSGSGRRSVAPPSLRRSWAPGRSSGPWGSPPRLVASPTATSSRSLTASASWATGRRSHLRDQTTRSSPEHRDGISSGDEHRARSRPRTRPEVASKAPQRATSLPAGATFRPASTRSSCRRYRPTSSASSSGSACATSARQARRSSPAPARRAGTTSSSSRSCSPKRPPVAIEPPVKSTAGRLGCRRARPSTPGTPRPR
jgi:hypothetical protein